MIRPCHRPRPLIREDGVGETTRPMVCVSRRVPRCHQRSMPVVEGAPETAKNPLAGVLGSGKARMMPRAGLEPAPPD
jgi:hypothetical protein